MLAWGIDLKGGAEVKEKPGAWWSKGKTRIEMRGECPRKYLTNIFFRDHVCTDRATPED